MTASPNLYLVRYSPDLIKGLSNGTFQQAVGPNGGILSNVIGMNEELGRKGFVGHGEFSKLKGVNAAGVALGVWQVMAIVTAQKFLADINRRLAKLENGIQEVKAWLEQEAWSTLISSYNHLSQYVDALNRNEIHSVEFHAFLNQAENIDRDCARIQSLFYNRMLDEFEMFKSQEVAGVGLKDHAEQLRDHGLTYLTFHAGALTALRVRSAAAQFRLVLPVPHDLTEGRFKEIKASFQSCKDHLQSFIEVTQTQVAHLQGSWISFPETDAEFRRYVSDSVDRHLSNVRNISDDLKTGIEECTDGLKEVKKLHQTGMTLAIELGPDGKITKVNQVAE